MVLNVPFCDRVLGNCAKIKNRIIGIAEDSPIFGKYSRY